MGSSKWKEYQLPEKDYAEVAKDSLTHIEQEDLTEVWLFQWPKSQYPVFNGKEVSLKLNAYGELGSVEDSEGKCHELMSNNTRGPHVVAFSPCDCGSEYRIGGKISRHVSLVRYPEPEELKTWNSNRSNHPSSSTSNLSSGRRSSNPTRTSNPQRMSSKQRQHSTSGGGTKSSNPSKSFISSGDDDSGGKKKKKKKQKTSET